MTIKDDVIEQVFKCLYNQFSFIESDEVKFKDIILINDKELVKYKDDKELYEIVLKKAKIKIYDYFKKYFNDGKFTEIITNYINKVFGNKKLSVRSFTFINELLIKTKYNPSFDEYNSLFNNAGIIIFTEKCVDGNLEKIKEQDYSFLNDNSFLISMIETYCVVNNLVEETVDDEHLVSDFNDEMSVDDRDYHSDSVRAYLLEIGNYKLLSAEEERKYALLYKQGDSYAKEVLVNHNLKLVVSIAKRYKGRGVSFLDLIQEGNIGLMIAIDKFDVTQGFKLSTYATWWIRQTITRAIADKGRTIRVPVHMYEKIGVFKKTIDLLSKELNREPTIEEMAKKLGITVVYAKELNSFMNNEPVSMHTIVGDEDSELGDFIPDNSQSPENEGIKEVMRNEVHDFIESAGLKPKELEVLKYRFGLYDETGVPMTLSQVAEIFNVTRERIRQVEAKALMKLRRSRKVWDFAQYLDDPDKGIDALMEYRKLSAGSRHVVPIDIVRSDSSKKSKTNSSKVLYSNIKVPGSEQQKNNRNGYLFPKFKNNDQKEKEEKPKARAIAKKRVNVSSTDSNNNVTILEKTKVISTNNIVNEKEKLEGDVKMTNEETKTNGRTRKELKNIYHYFNEYSEEQIDNMLKQLPEEDIKLLHKRFGDDLKNPIYNSKITKEENARLYGGILPKMKRVLSGKKPRKNRATDKSDSLSKTKNDVANLEEKVEESPVVKQEILEDNNVIVSRENYNHEITEDLNSSRITSNDYIKVLEIFNNPEFIEMTKTKSLMECVILSLKLGYIDGKYFSSSAIANFLGIDVQQVNNIAKEGLMEYKEKLNQMIDTAIESNGLGSDKPYTKIIKNTNE